MFDSAAPNLPASASDQLRESSEADLASQLPADVYWHLVRTLRLTLPPPEGDQPEDLLRRDHAAIARIASLAPANAAEADVAAQFVAASEQWKECLRLATLAETSEPPNAASEAPAKAGATPQWAHKCRAQANSMMRQANAALRLQAAREKRDADQVTRDRAAWSEHCALSLMAEALSRRLPPPDLARPSRPPAPDRRRRPPPPAGAPPTPDPAAQSAAAAREAELVVAAERYAARYPERAARIRRTGKLPSDVVYFCPSEAALAQALIHARTPALALLDAPPADQEPAT